MSKPRPCTSALAASIRGMLVAMALGLGASACADIDDRPANWSYVYATIIQPGCTTANCHSELGAAAGLMFHNRESAYVFLTGRVCEPLDTQNPPDHNFVVPYDPERSKLMYLLRGEEVRVMPPDVPLPSAEIELVERWILEGAQCN